MFTNRKTFWDTRRCSLKKEKKKFLYNKIVDYENRSGCHRRETIGRNRRYEAAWKKLRKRYPVINVYGIEFVGIGETIPRLFMYLRDKPQRTRDVFHLVLPTFFPDYTAGIVNRGIFDIFQSQIHFVTEKNIGFWKYVFLKHSDQINIDFFNRYQFRDVSVKFDVGIGKPLITFTKDIEEYAENKMRNMGVTGRYICIHAREVSTKTNNFADTYADTSVLDADINTFRQACLYMQNLGYQIIRIGKDESKECEIENVIDYANKFYDEIMDFYLIANCKFLLGSSSGITSITAFWGRPILQTNALSFCYGQESLPRTKYDMYIPKKFYSLKKGKYLDLYEMLDVTYKCDRYNARLAKEGIEIYDNTDEEILSAAKEMNEKLDGTWVQTEKEVKCMEKYWQIINAWKEKHKVSYKSRADGGKGREMFPRPICYSYLKENMYLINEGAHEKL